MFIQDSDYKKVINAASLAAITQIDNATRLNAESAAIEEVSGYLRSRYNVTEIFSATATQEGDNRNPQIVMICCDVALYHLSASMPQRIGTEVREERYKRAIEWLEAVQAGKVSPDLPLATNADGGDASFASRIKFQPRNHNNW